MRRFALGLGLLALAAGGIFLLARTRDGDGVGKAISRDEAGTAAEPAHLGGRPSGEALSEIPDASATADDASGEAAGGTVRVELPVRVEIDQADAAVVIDVRALSWSLASVDFLGPRGTRSGPGPCRLDLTDLVRWIRDRGRRPEIALDAAAPMHVGTPVHVVLPSPDDLLAGRTRLDPVILVLRPATGVSGRVVGVDGGAVEGAEVELFLLTPDGPERGAVAETASDEEGAFTLATARSGRHLLVATWLALDGATGETTARPLPASVVVDLEVGRALGGLVLRLRRSFTIRGRVLVDGATASGATIGWRLAGDARALRDSTENRYGMDTWHYFLGGDVHWARIPVRTDSRGHFEILGASAVPYRVGVEDVRGAHLHRMSKEAAEVEVTPPTDDLVFDLHLARLVLQVRLDGRPVALEEKVDLSDMGMHPELGDDVCWGTWFGETDGNGRLEVALTPGHRYGVIIEEPGYEQWWHHVEEAPAAGETLTLTVDLVRKRPRPRLVVVLESPGAESPEKASFGFYEPDVDPMSRTPWPLLSAKPEHGRYVLEDLVPGPHRLHVRPGRDWFDAPGEWLEAVVDVEIPAAGEVEITVPVKRGGRLLIETTDVDGRYLECPCTVRDASGQALRTHFFVRLDGGGGIYAAELPGSGPAWVDRTLLAGAYEITLEPEGYVREVRTVEIREGTPTTLRVTLHKP